MNNTLQIVLILFPFTSNTHLVQLHFQKQQRVPTSWVSALTCRISRVVTENQDPQFGSKLPQGTACC
jgi:hypothetical protein